MTTLCIVVANVFNDRPLGLSLRFEVLRRALASTTPSDWHWFAQTALLAPHSRRAVNPQYAQPSLPRRESTHLNNQILAPVTSVSNRLQPIPPFAAETHPRTAALFSIPSDFPHQFSRHKCIREIEVNPNAIIQPKYRGTKAAQKCA